jgi:uncharacterized protein YcsI (UPF0317 family)
MYLSNIQCQPAGRISGNMVVSMRPIPSHQIADAVKITARMPSVHGAPYILVILKVWAFVM